MHVSKLTGRAAAIGGFAGRVMAQGNGTDCPDGISVVEVQPIEIVYLGPPRSTETVTLTRTQVIEGDGGDPPATTGGPDEYVTITRPPSSDFTEPITIPPSNGSPGTVIVPGPWPTTSATLTPDPEFTTITVPWIGATTRTRTVSGTVIIETPLATPTDPETTGPETTGPTSAPVETTPSASSSPAPTSLETVTITEPWDGISSTSTTVPGTPPGPDTPGTPATVIIQPPRCSPGLAWAYYNLEEGEGEGQIPFHEDTRQDPEAPYWPTEIFSIATSMAGQEPELVGQTTTIGIAGLSPPQTLVIYGTETGNTGPWTLLHHTGYFNPNQAGDYTFSVPERDTPFSPDDTTFVWFGDNAVSGYASDNSDMLSDVFTENRGQREYTYTVTEADVGSYIPFRYLGVNAQGAMIWPFEVTDPAGEVIFSESVETNDGQFLNACEGSTEAPPFDF